jgi:hypothetical protein
MLYNVRDAGRLEFPQDPTSEIGAATNIAR